MNKSELQEYFLSNNKSGHKTNERWLSVNNTLLYNEIVDKYKSIVATFSEKVCLYVNGLNDVPKCPNCDKNVKYNGTLRKGYNKYCSIKCLNSSEEHKKLIIASNNLKYGVDSHNQTELVKYKKKETSLKNYGVDNPMKCNKISLKQKTTLLDKYNVTNPMNIGSVINNRIDNVINGTELNIQRMLNRITDTSIKFIKHDSNKNVFFHRNKCNADFNLNSNLLTSRIANNTTICTNCNKNKSYSNILLQLTTFLDSININYIINDRKILKGKELDIYLPDHKLGIEINGLYWHSNKYKRNNYHLNKTKLCDANGVKLLHFFEDEILGKIDVVKKIILNKINDKIEENIYIIKEVNNIELTNKFLLENTLSLNDYSDIKIGAFKNDNLVSLMQFNKSKSIDEYKLSGLNIENCAEHTLRYFIDNYSPKSIIVFNDRRFLNNIYENLGFKIIKNTKPKYRYIISGKFKRYLRSELTETELKSNGLHKIYDCGSVKMKLTIN